MKKVIFATVPYWGYFINHVKVRPSHCTGKRHVGRALFLLIASGCAAYFRRCRGINHHDYESKVVIQSVRQEIEVV